MLCVLNAVPPRGPREGQAHTPLSALAGFDLYRGRTAGRPRAVRGHGAKGRPAGAGQRPFRTSSAFARGCGSSSQMSFPGNTMPSTRLPSASTARKRLPDAPPSSPAGRRRSPGAGGQRAADRRVPPCVNAIGSSRSWGATPAPPGRRTRDRRGGRCWRAGSPGASPVGIGRVRSGNWRLRSRDRRG